MRNKKMIYPLMMSVLGLLTTFSCKKNEEIIKKDPVITWANQADISVGTLLGATQLNATADVAGTFIYTPVSGTQLIEGANQDLRADFTPKDAALYNTASKTVKINVIAKKTPVITWVNPADIPYGTLLGSTQLNATADVPGIFLYNPASGTKLNTGTNQELKVDFTPTDAVNYNTTSKTVKINVTSPLPLTITDADGNIYHTVVIGTQTWMIENLRTTKYNDNTSAIPNVTDQTAWSTITTPAFCWYNNDAATHKASYGALYNWYSVNTGKLCPTGWHVPSDIEWTTMETFLIDNGYNYNGSLTGNYLAKAIGSTTNWTESTTSGAVGNTDYPEKRNVTNFTAVAGGCRDVNGIFSYLKVYSFLWSASMNDATSCWNRDLFYWGPGIARSSFGKNNGFSVRCLKD